MPSYPKNKPFRSRSYLDWLRERRPICCGFGPTEPHHLKLFKNGSMGMKPPDNDCIPVPWSVHHDIHSRGERAVLLDDAGFTVGYLRDIADNFYNQWRQENNF